jgi:hypothetical protein
LDLRPYILAYLALLFQGKLALSSIYISTTQAVAGKAGKRGTYTKDTHVWVYTSKFAKRFGMPQEWVDDELKGAEALAYRVVVKRYFDMFLRFVVLFVFIIAVGLIF